MDTIHNTEAEVKYKNFLEGDGRIVHEKSSEKCLVFVPSWFGQRSDDGREQACKKKHTFHYMAFFLMVNFTMVYFNQTIFNICGHYFNKL